MKIDDLKTNFMPKKLVGENSSSYSSIMSPGAASTNRSNQGLILNSNIKLNNRSNFMEGNLIM